MLVFLGRCPVEDDRLVLGRSRPLITGSENHTAFIKVSLGKVQLDTVTVVNITQLQWSTLHSYSGEHYTVTVVNITQLRL